MAKKSLLRLQAVGATEKPKFQFKTKKSFQIGWYAFQVITRAVTRSLISSQSLMTFQN